MCAVGCFGEVGLLLRIVLSGEVIVVEERGKNRLIIMMIILIWLHLLDNIIYSNIMHQ